MFTKISVGLVGIICLLLGLIALAAPERAGEALGIQAITPFGQNSLRADFGAFFLMSGAVCCAALLARKSSWLWPVSMLFAFAAIGRVLGIVIDGLPDQVIGPIVVEILFALILANGARKLG